MRNLPESPDPAAVMSGLPANAPDIGSSSFRRTKLVLQTFFYPGDSHPEDSDSADCSVELPYEASTI